MPNRVESRPQTTSTDHDDDKAFFYEMKHNQSDYIVLWSILCVSVSVKV